MTCDAFVKILSRTLAFIRYNNQQSRTLVLQVFETCKAKVRENIWKIKVHTPWPGHTPVTWRTNLYTPLPQPHNSSYLVIPPYLILWNHELLNNFPPERFVLWNLLIMKSFCSSYRFRGCWINVCLPCPVYSVCSSRRTNHGTRISHVRTSPNSVHPTSHQVCFSFLYFFLRVSDFHQK